MLLSSMMLALSLVAREPMLPTAASAEERSEEQCLQLHPEITSPVEIVRCTSALDESEGAVQKAFAELLSRVTPEARPNLQRAQMAWRAYRDAHCEFSASGSGTAHSSAVIACLADMNRARAKELEDDRERWTD